MNFYSLRTDYFPVSHLASNFNLDIWKRELQIEIKSKKIKEVFYKGIIVRKFLSWFSITKMGDWSKRIRLTNAMNSWSLLLFEELFHKYGHKDLAKIVLEL